MAPSITRLYASAAQTALARQTDNKVQLNTASYDALGGLDATNKRLVFKRVGYWEVAYQVMTNTFTNVGQPAFIEAWLGFNGSVTAKQAWDCGVVSAASQQVGLKGIDVFRITAITQFVEIYTRYSSATAGAAYNVPIIATGIMPVLNARWLSS